METPIVACAAMPYWSIFCLHCAGRIVDALLECVPWGKQVIAGFQLLYHQKPGAALACPYCNGLIGFNDAGQPQLPVSGWPVFRYGRAELEIKKQQDGEPAAATLADWALGHRFTQPGAQKPLSAYTYAEDAPTDETVP